MSPKQPKTSRKRKSNAGRPRKILNRETIVKLTAKGATLHYLAAYLGVSDDTITRNYAEAIEAGRSLRDGSLQMRQFQVAHRGNSTMLKWLGQQWLGQRDKQDIQSTGAGGGPIINANVELKAKSLAELLAEIRRDIDNGKDK